MKGPGRPVIAKLFLGVAITVAAISAAAPTSANPGNPFNHLWMDSRCCTSAPAAVCHNSISGVQAGIHDGLNDMQSVPAPGGRPS
jgi:hypothetical protein